MGIMRIPFGEAGFGFDGIEGMTFRAHLVIEGPFLWGIVKIIRDIPYRFLYLVCHTIVVTVNAGNTGFGVLVCQDIISMVPFDIRLHDMTGRAGKLWDSFHLMHQDNPEDADDEDSCQ